MAKVIYWWLGLNAALLVWFLVRTAYYDWKDKTIRSWMNH